eukprot:CAMPEP_0198695146 /NCGR_PEP_ID=MMETSP1468-20131203/282834_1 /TAXON_ID=1461545 /ORGANISM="Mantoniella sp, Strain CCMP1436" /LENGTH=67 /DNA_ID=CAMNT_0044450741 /DNA_START=15 /DNA_END=218 /DNA_ORIENTATION=-
MSRSSLSTDNVGCPDASSTGRAPRACCGTVPSHGLHPAVVGAKKLHCGHALETPPEPWCDCKLEQWM